MPRSRCPDQDAQIEMPRSRCTDRDAQIEMPKSRCPDRDAQIEMPRSPDRDAQIEIIESTPQDGSNTVENWPLHLDLAKSKPVPNRVVNISINKAKNNQT